MSFGSAFQLGKIPGGMFSPIGVTSAEGLLPSHFSKPTAVKGPSFQDALVNLAQQTNNIVQQPTAMLQEAMTTGKPDIHDIMIANSKAELTVNIATQVTTKIIQAYDRVLQIQI